RVTGQCFDYSLLLLMVQAAASSLRARRIYGAGTLLDMLDLALLIDHERSAIGDASRGDQNSVILGYFALREIAQQGKTEVQLGCKFLLRGSIVRTDTEDLCVHSFKFGDTSLVRQHFLRSTTGECGREERQHDCVLSAEIRELHFLPV